MTQQESPPDPLALSDAARATLVRALRVAFPHQSFPDGPYERTADKVIEAAGASTWLQLVLAQGLGNLDTLAGGAFADADQDTGTKVLKRVETTEFFGLLRRTAVVALYDDHEVWDVLGYEGSSFEHGGYIDRGFDDLDWLPSPRVEEYSGAEQMVEVAPDLVGAGVAGRTQPASSPDANAASHPGVAPQEAQDILTPEAI